MTEAEWLAGTYPTPMLGLLRGRASDRKLRLFAVGGALRFRDVLESGGRFPDLLDPATGVAGRHADGSADRGELDAARHAVPPAPDVRAGYADHTGWPVYAAAAVTDPYPFNAAARMDRLLDRIGEEAWVRAYMMPIPGLDFSCSRQELGGMIRRWRRDRGGTGVPSPVPDGWETLYANWDAVRDASQWGQAEARLRGGELAALLRDIFGNPFRPVTFDPSCRTSTAVTLARTVYEDRAFDRLPILADALEEAGCDDAEILAHLQGEGPHVRGCWAVDLVLGKE